MTAATPEQIQQLLDGLATQPDLLETFKKALGLEKKKEIFHPKTYSRLEKFSGEDSQWQEWVFNLIMTTKKVSKEVGEAMERIILECGTKLEMTIVKGIVKDDGLMNKYGAEMFAILCELTGGEANAVVRGVNNKGLGYCGFCAFYALDIYICGSTPKPQRGLYSSCTWSLTLQRLRMFDCSQKQSKTGKPEGLNSEPSLGKH